MTAIRRGLAAGLLGTVVATGASGESAAVPGDAARGRAVFEAKGCAGCHPPRDAGRGMGPPLEVVRRPQGMLELAGRLWNHAPVMLAVLLGKEGVTWPELSPPQMADLMAYLQAEPSRDPAADRLQGQALLVRKGCLKCHRLRGEGGAVGIELASARERYRSPVVWATAVWNHSPRMAGHAARLGVLYPRFSGDEMVHLVEFLKSAAAAPR